jgi:formamidopyrimidine-DNA glycosylase
MRGLFRSHRKIPMPELPEVETTRQSILSLIGKRFKKVTIHNGNLRWPVPNKLGQFVKKQVINAIERRGKYLLLGMNSGTILIHLGMSGCLRLGDQSTPLRKHDHVDFLFEDNTLLRYHDPRRFGSVLWTIDKPEDHPRLTNLGPEPLSRNFNADYFFKQAQDRSVPIKTFLMNSTIVVGVGNIYATESLFTAGIHPLQAAGEISLTQCQLLIKAVKTTLRRAIQQGGTTLKDFTSSDGKPGYFQQSLQVYGRSGSPCINCDSLLVKSVIGGRATVHCTECQKAG